MIFLPACLSQSQENMVGRLWLHVASQQVSYDASFGVRVHSLQSVSCAHTRL